MAKKTEPVVSGGKIIPPHIVQFLESFMRWLAHADEDKEVYEAVFGASLESLYDAQEAVHEGDIEAAIKNMLVVGVEAIAETQDNPEMSLKEATELQIGMFEKLNETRAVMTTLVMHQWANYNGTEIPSDLKLGGEGDLYSSTFEDAE